MILEVTTPYVERFHALSNIQILNLSVVLAGFGEALTLLKKKMNMKFRI